MFNQNQALRQYLKRRQDAINSEKPKEEQTSDLFDEKTFYGKFTKDLMEAKKEIIIFSPFVTKFRTDFYKQTIQKLRDKNIEVFIFTRPLEEYDDFIQPQISCSLKRYEEMGVCVFYPGKYIHQKVAVIDREILWEGSLNILSHRASQEMMRRTPNESAAMQVVNYLGLNNKLAEAYKLRYERLCRNLANDTRINRKVKVRMLLLGLAIPIIIWWIPHLARIALFLLRIIKIFS